ncbi:hypothetical protein [Demequina sp. NBRC 110055]|uniref:hypothetical protein n=1 Tax=Demequina sp. NBRC 110055 TaxID=1570344 RepID=UPI000A06E4C2|nr:hypothetical protein [Demequina sp. NBRC 110055]
MPYKDFGAEVLTASDVNTYLMRQSLIRVANQSELDAIPTPVAGMMATRLDNGITYRHDGSSWKRHTYATGAMMQAGAASTTTIPASTSAWADVLTVTFAIPFAATPSITFFNSTSYSGSDPILWSLGSYDATGFTLRAKCASSKTAQFVHWVATARTQ